MANIVITSNTNSIKVDFGAYGSTIGYDKAAWRKETVRFSLSSGATFIDVHVQDETDWAVSFNGSGSTLQIDSVDGAAPASNSDLYDKLIALIA